MPLSIDSSGGVTFDYSIGNVNKSNASKNKEEVAPQKEIAQANVEKSFRELPKEEVEALFLNRQDSQLNRDILNTFASNNNANQSSEFSFDNLDTFQKILEENETQPS